MKTYIARSIFETQARLEQAVSVDHQTRQQGTPWISDNYRETLVSSLAQLRASSAEHGQVRERFLHAQKQRRSEVDALSRLVRDFFQVLRRRSTRLGHRDAIEALYKRPARVPQSATVIEWLEWAKNIVQGEAQAQALAYPAMTNPSASEIATARARASASEDQWSEHFQQLKIQEQHLRQAREQGTRTLRGLALRLRETLARETPTTRRDLMRTFGFSFISTGAKDRQKPSGPSNLANLIKPAPQTQEDEDTPQANASIVQIQPLRAPQPIRLQKPIPEGIPEAPAPAPAQDLQSNTPNEHATAPQTAKPADPKSEPQTRNDRLTKAQPTAQNQEPKPKLSRRQKKAQRRALREAYQKPTPTITPAPALQAVRG